MEKKQINEKIFKIFTISCIFDWCTALVGCDNNQTSTLVSTQPSVAPSVDPAILEGQKTAANALKTKAQYEKEETQALADAIVAAGSEIENYVNPINYRKAQETQVLDLIDEYYAKVQATTFINNVNAIVTEFKGLIDAIPVDTGFTGALEKGSIVSFTQASTPMVADLFIKPTQRTGLVMVLLLERKN